MNSQKHRRTGARRKGASPRRSYAGASAKIQRRAHLCIFVMKCNMVPVLQRTLIIIGELYNL